VITRRRFVQGATAASLSVAGVGILVRVLSRRYDFQRLGPYAPLFEGAVGSEAMDAEVAAIGSEYLTRIPGVRDPLGLLRELSPLGLGDAQDGDPDAVAMRLRDDVQARIQTDFRNGALLRLRGYFVPESLAKFCAAVFLALAEAD